MLPCYNISMANMFGVPMSDPIKGAETIYKNSRFRIDKSPLSSYYIYDRGTLSYVRQDINDALRQVCDLSFTEWSKEYLEQNYNLE